MSKAAKDMGLDTTEYEKVCAAPYARSVDYLDPEKFRQDIYAHFLTEYDLLPKISAPVKEATSKKSSK